MSSRLGSVGVSPYADDEAAYTTRFTFASLAATRRVTVPSTLARLLSEDPVPIAAPTELLLDAV